MSTIETEIEIDVPLPRAWQILTDFEAYAQWNPFVREIRPMGSPAPEELEVGTRLDVCVALGDRGMRIRPRISRLEPGRGFRWLGHAGMAGIFDGEHSFDLEPLGPQRVRFMHCERFSGLLSRPVLRLVGARTRKGFVAMNEAFKARCEGA